MARGSVGRYYGRRGGYRRRGYGGGGGYYKRKYFQQQRLKAKIRNQLIGAAGGRGTPANIERWGTDWATATADQKMGRQMFGYYGKGDYKDALRWGSRGLGALAGAGIGFSAGGGKGALRGGRLGYDAGAQFSKWAGWGDYQGGGSGGVGVNDIMMDESQKKITVNPSNASGDIIFQHTEFIQNLTIPYTSGGASGFNVQSFGINPGLEGTFPFLAQLAGNFALYELEGLIFQYKPTSGEGATNALGKVIMATNYDPSAQPFTNSQAMENYDYAHSVKPSQGMHHGVETASGQRLTNQLYVRTNVDNPGPSLPGEKDKVLTDIGLFQIATEGIQEPPMGTGSYVVGELWVTYKVKLSRASLVNTQASVLTNFYSTAWMCDGSNGIIKTKQYECPTNSLGIFLETPLTTQIKMTWPENVVAGDYLVTLRMYANTGANWVNDAVGTNCQLLDQGFQGVGGTMGGPLSAVTVGTSAQSFSYLSVAAGTTPVPCYMMRCRVRVLAPDNALASLTINMAGAASAPGAIDPALWLKVTQVSEDMGDNLTVIA